MATSAGPALAVRGFAPKKIRRKVEMLPLTALLMKPEVSFHWR